MSMAKTDPIRPKPLLVDQVGCRDTAYLLLKHDLWPVAIKPGEKAPIGNAWGTTRATPGSIRDIYDEFRGAGVGIVLGPGKGPDGTCLIDLEGDGETAENSRAALMGGEEIQTLGWSSVRGRHELYLADWNRLQALLTKMGGAKVSSGVYHFEELPDLEIRIGGFKPDGTPKQLQSCCPPTLGTDGRPREWNGLEDPATLPEAFYLTLERIIEEKNAKTIPFPTQTQSHSDRGGNLDKRVVAYLNKCEAAISGERGHDKAFKAACKVGPGFDLSPEQAFQCLWAHYNPRCEPPWSEAELRHKVSDAYDKELRRGWFLDARLADRRFQAIPQWSTNGGSGGSGGGVDTDEPDEPESPKPRAPESVDDPDRLSRLALNKKFTQGTHLTLRHHLGEFYVYKDGAYEPIPKEYVEGSIYESSKEEFDEQALKARGRWEKKRQEQQEQAEKPENNGRLVKGQANPPVSRKVTRSLVGDVLGAVKPKIMVPLGVTQPCWLDGSRDIPFPSQDVLCAKNGLIHLPSLIEGKDNYFCPPTPRFFSSYRVDYDFNPDAPEPYWFPRFLKALFQEDQESCDLIQEWFGLQLTQDVSFQKILGVIGPKRSGKGTLARLLKALVGEANVANPTLGSLLGEFGLGMLYRKPLAIIPDARISRHLDAVAAVERLLSISGEDSQEINRKYMNTINVKLTTRFTIFSNEMFQLPDPSGALMGRLLVLRLTESFYGKEDRSLTDKLLGELPSILMWSIRGWARLKERGYFIQPASSKAMLQTMEDLGSPVGKFVRECCLNGGEVSKGQLYERWVGWCKEEGRDHPGTKEKFGKDLRAVKPLIEEGQRRIGGGVREHTYKGIQLIDTQWETS